MGSGSSAQQVRRYHHDWESDVSSVLHGEEVCGKQREHTREEMPAWGGGTSLYNLRTRSGVYLVSSNPRREQQQHAKTGQRGNNP